MASRWGAMVASGIATFLVGALVSAAEPATSAQVAQTFWSAFLNADAEQMSKHYASRVTVKAGSELLKAEYLLNPSGEMNKDVTVDRKSVTRGYHIMFERVGKAKWIENSKRLANVELSYISAADNNRYFALFGASAGELLVQVHTEPEPLFFLLQQDDKQRWRIVAEAFD